MKRMIMSLMAVSLPWLLPASAADDPEPQGAPKNRDASKQTQPAAQQPGGKAQPDPSALPGLLQWLQSKATTTADASSSEAATNAGKSMPKQTQSISIDHGSTTLIDQSSGSDLLSTALNLTPVSSGTSTGGSNSTSGTQGSGTVTSSAYGIWALLHPHQDSLAPDLYNTHAPWRRFFFTVGREQSNSNSSSGTNSSGTGTSAPASSPRAATPTSNSSTPAQPGTVAGAQVLLVQHRDASNIVNNGREMDMLRKIAFSGAAINGKYTTALIHAICGNPVDGACEASVMASGNNASQTVQTEIDKLSPARKTEVMQLATDYNDEVKNADVANRLNQAIQYLQHRAQVSLNFQTTQRTGGLPDDYLAELIFDEGLGKKWLFTVNGSYDYSNSSMIGADLRTERGALQFGRTLVSPGTHLKSPLQFNLSGEGVHQDTGWHYRAQVQLVVPITNGIDFPLSFGYGNETNALRQEDEGVYGKFGLTVDFGKLIDALHSQQH